MAMDGFAAEVDPAAVLISGYHKRPQEHPARHTRVRGFWTATHRDSLLPGAYGRAAPAPHADGTRAHVRCTAATVGPRSTAQVTSSLAVVTRVAFVRSPRVGAGEAQGSQGLQPTETTAHREPGSAAAADQRRADRAGVGNPVVPLGVTFAPGEAG